MQIKDYQVILLGIIITLGCVFSTYILSNSIIEFQKLQNQTIRVTGSASQNITSDAAALTIRFKAKENTLKAGYDKINEDTKTIKEYLIKNGMEEKNIDFEAVNSYENFKRTMNGNTTNEIESYTVYRAVTVKSKDINKITELSKNTTELINKDINLTTDSVQYYVSNLDDIKIKMVGEASKNAKERAESMVKGTNGHIGVMNSAKMGVFQIVPIDSTDVSDYGYNDTTSIDKKVIATVSATFTVK